MIDKNTPENSKWELVWQEKIQERVKREFVDVESLSEEEIRSRIGNRGLSEEQFVAAIAIFNKENCYTPIEMFTYLVELRQQLEEIESLGWWKRRKYKKMTQAARTLHDLLEV